MDESVQFKHNHHCDKDETEAGPSNLENHTQANQSKKEDEICKGDPDFPDGRDTTIQSLFRRRATNMEKEVQKLISNSSDCQNNEIFQKGGHTQTICHSMSDPTNGNMSDTRPEKMPDKSYGSDSTIQTSFGKGNPSADNTSFDNNIRQKWMEIVNELHLKNNNISLEQLFEFPTEEIRKLVSQNTNRQNNQNVLRRELSKSDDDTEDECDESPEQEGLSYEKDGTVRKQYSDNDDLTDTAEKSNCKILQLYKNAPSSHKLPTHIIPGPVFRGIPVGLFDKNSSNEENDSKLENNFTQGNKQKNEASRLISNSLPPQNLFGFPKNNCNYPIFYKKDNQEAFPEFSQQMPGPSFNRQITNTSIDEENSIETDKALDHLNSTQNKVNLENLFGLSSEQIQKIMSHKANGWNNVKFHRKREVQAISCECSQIETKNNNEELSDDDSSESEDDYNSANLEPTEEVEKCQTTNDDKQTSLLFSKISQFDDTVSMTDNNENTVDDYTFETASTVSVKYSKTVVCHNINLKREKTSSISICSKSSINISCQKKATESKNKIGTLVEEEKRQVISALIEALESQVELKTDSTDNLQTSNSEQEESEESDDNNEVESHISQFSALESNQQFINSNTRENGSKLATINENEEQISKDSLLTEDLVPTPINLNAYKQFNNQSHQEKIINNGNQSKEIIKPQIEENISLPMTKEDMETICDPPLQFKNKTENNKSDNFHSTINVNAVKQSIKIYQEFNSKPTCSLTKNHCNKSLDEMMMEQKQKLASFKAVFDQFSQGPSANLLQFSNKDVHEAIEHCQKKYQTKKSLSLLENVDQPNAMSYAAVANLFDLSIDEIQNISLNSDYRQKSMNNSDCQTPPQGILKESFREMVRSSNAGVRTDLFPSSLQNVKELTMPSDIHQTEAKIDNQQMENCLNSKNSLHNILEEKPYSRHDGNLISITTGETSKTFDNNEQDLQSPKLISNRQLVPPAISNDSHNRSESETKNATNQIFNECQSQTKHYERQLNSFKSDKSDKPIKSLFNLPFCNLPQLTNNCDENLSRDSNETRNSENMSNQEYLSESRFFTANNSIRFPNKEQTLPEHYRSLSEPVEKLSNTTDSVEMKNKLSTCDKTMENFKNIFNLSAEGIQHLMTNAQLLQSQLCLDKQTEQKQNLETPKVSQQYSCMKSSCNDSHNQQGFIKHKSYSTVYSEESNLSVERKRDLLVERLLGNRFPKNDRKHVVNQGKQSSEGMKDYENSTLSLPNETIVNVTDINHSNYTTNSNDVDLHTPSLKEKLKKHVDDLLNNKCNPHNNVNEKFKNCQEYKGEAVQTSIQLGCPSSLIGHEENKGFPPNKLLQPIEYSTKNHDDSISIRYDNDSSSTIPDDDEFFGRKIKKAPTNNFMNSYLLTNNQKALPSPSVTSIISENLGYSENPLNRIISKIGMNSSPPVDEFLQFKGNDLFLLPKKRIPKPSRKKTKAVKHTSCKECGYHKLYKQQSNENLSIITFKSTINNEEEFVKRQMDYAARTFRKRRNDPPRITYRENNVPPKSSTKDSIVSKRDCIHKHSGYSKTRKYVKENLKIENFNLINSKKINDNVITEEDEFFSLSKINMEDYKEEVISFENSSCTETEQDSDNQGFCNKQTILEKNIKSVMLKAQNFFNQCTANVIKSEKDDWSVAKELKCFHEPCKEMVDMSEMVTHFKAYHKNIPSIVLSKGKHCSFPCDAQLVIPNNSYCLAIIDVYDNKEITVKNDTETDNDTIISTPPVQQNDHSIFWLMVTGVVDEDKLYGFYWLFTTTNNSSTIELTSKHKSFSLLTFNRVINTILQTKRIGHISQHLKNLALNRSTLIKVTDIDRNTHLKIFVPCN